MSRAERQPRLQAATGFALLFEVEIEMKRIYKPQLGWENDMRVNVPTCTVVEGETVTDANALSTRARRVLGDAIVSDVYAFEAAQPNPEEVALLKWRYLAGVPNCGIGTIAEIRDWLAKFGLVFADERQVRSAKIAHMQWSALCREIVLTAVKLAALEERAREIMGKASPGSIEVMSSTIGSGCSILGIGDSIQEMRETALEAGIVTPAEVSKARLLKESD